MRKKKGSLKIVWVGPIPNTYQVCGLCFKLLLYCNWVTDAFVICEGCLGIRVLQMRIVTLGTEVGFYFKCILGAGYWINFNFN